MNLDEKKQYYKSEISNIAKESFNEEQKQLAYFILDNANENNIENIYTFITQRIKLGFVFDVAPEISHNTVALCSYNNKMSFGNISGTKHKLIIGENYDALKNLLVTYTKNGEGLIDVIYIDPPYNTESTHKDGNDYKDDVKSEKFIYRDKFTRTGWLNMMRERLTLARKLLSNKGVIFISIDDTEQAYLKILCDEIFGENNFYGQFIQLKGNTQNDSKTIQKNHEYILCYVKSYDDLLLTYENVVLHEVFEDKYYLGRDTGSSSGHDTLLDRNNLGYTIYYYEGTGNGVTGNHNTLLDRNNLGYNKFKVFHKGNKIYHAIALKDYSVDNLNKNSKESDIYSDDEYLLSLGYHIIRPPKRSGGELGCWTWGFDTFLELWNNDEVLIKNDKNVIKKEFIKGSDIIEKNGKKYFPKKNILPAQSIINITNSLGTTELKEIFSKKTFDNPKSTNLIKYLVNMATYSNPNATILDFFAGSGTTGQAVMELNQSDGGNRQCILVTNNENNIATDITYERLYRVVNGIGTKGETFNWTFSDSEHYLKNNYWDIFELKYHELKIDDYEKADKLVKSAEKEFKMLNPNYESKNFDIYNQLASLKPYKKD